MHARLWRDSGDKGVCVCVCVCVRARVGKGGGGGAGRYMQGYGRTGVIREYAEQAEERSINTVVSCVLHVQWPRQPSLIVFHWGKIERGRDGGRGGGVGSGERTGGGGVWVGEDMCVRCPWHID